MPDPNPYINGFLRAFQRLNQTSSECHDGVLGPVNGESLEEQFLSLSSSTSTQKTDIRFEELEKPWDSMLDGLQVWMFRFLGYYLNDQGNVRRRPSETSNLDFADFAIGSIEYPRSQAQFLVLLIEESYSIKAVHKVTWKVIYKESGKPTYAFNQEFWNAFLIETEEQNQLLYLASNLK